MPASHLRALDKLWLAYFIIIIPITIFVDLQDFWLPFVPQFLIDFKAQYLLDSGDPLVGQTLGGPVQLAWFTSFVYLKAYYQLPVFFVAIYGLLKGRRWVYIPMLTYATMISVIILACIATFNAVPRKTVDLPTGTLSLTHDNYVSLMSSYLPFLVLPTIMAVYASLELAKDVRLATEVRKSRAGKKVQ